MRRLIRPVLAAAVGAVLVLAAVRFQRSSASPPVEPTGSTPPIAPRPEQVVCFGTVDLDRGVAALGSIRPGRVAEVLVAENQHVEAGADLLRLEDGGAAGRVAEAKAAVELARVQRDQARKQPDLHRIRVAQQQAMRDALRSRVESARLVLDREQRLGKTVNINDSDRSISQEKIRETEALERVEILRLAELESQDPEADLRRAEAELKAAEARLSQAQSALEENRLRAPRPGTVLRILVGPGDLLGSQPAILFAADGLRVVRASVEQEFAGRVKEGMPAVVRDDTDDASTWRGRVARVAGWYSQRRTILHDPSQLSDVRTLECVIALDPGQPTPRLGQGVRIVLGPASP